MSELVEPILLEVKRDIDVMKRREIMLIKYENIIRNVEYHLLEVLQNPVIKKMFENIINYDEIIISNEFVYNRWFKNILEDLAFDPYDENLERYRKGIIDRYIDFYTKCEILPFKYLIDNLLNADRVVDKIYIIHPVNDIRVSEDVKLLFEDNSKIEMIFDSIENFMSTYTEVTSFVTDDVADIGKTISVGNIKWLEIMVADYKYNMDDTNNKLKIDTVSIIEKYICRLATFNPINIKKKEEE